MIKEILVTRLLGSKLPVRRPKTPVLFFLFFFTANLEEERDYFQSLLEPGDLDRINKRPDSVTL